LAAQSGFDLNLYNTEAGPSENLVSLNIIFDTQYLQSGSG
jgi:hypothetical protein